MRFATETISRAIEFNFSGVISSRCGKTARDNCSMEAQLWGWPTLSEPQDVPFPLVLAPKPVCEHVALVLGRFNLFP